MRRLAITAHGSLNTVSTPRSASEYHTTAHHEWVVIILRIRPGLRFHKYIPIWLGSGFVRLRLVANLGHDVCEGWVWRHNTSSHRGRWRVGSNGKYGTRGRVEGKRAGYLKEPSLPKILDVLIDPLHLGEV